MNPYEVLDIQTGASPDEIKAAYHGLAKKWHPDRYTGTAKVEAEQRFRMVAEAYNLLKDTPAREERPAPPPAPPPASAPIQLESGTDKPQASKSAQEWYKDAKAAYDAKSPERGLGLIQYAIRLDAEHGEFHALHAKLLEALRGDKRVMVRALENALRLNPKDVDSAILLAETFQALGMHARATRLWEMVRRVKPNHPVFAPAPGKGRKGERPSLGEQVSALVATAKDAIQRILKRG
jgi:tetratricopeptide (TPR) repeat protein